MKTNNRIEMFFCCILSLSIIFCNATLLYAATKTYKFADLDVQVEVPTELNVITRNVTSADPALELIKSNAESMHVTFEQQNIYMEAFPDDVAYEIILSGKTAADGTKDFNTINASAFNEGLQEYKKLSETSSTDKVQRADVYRNGTTSYYVIDFVSKTNDITVYCRKYYTVMQGKEISFTIQSKSNEINDSMSSQLTSIIDSAVFKNIDPSITDSAVFNELTGYLFAFAVTIGILSFLIYIMNKSTKKPKHDI